MEVAENTSSLKRGHDYDLELCVICQKKRRNKNRSSTDSVSIISGDALQTLRRTAEKRKKKLGTEFSSAISIIDAEFEKSPNPTFVWHREVCRPNFISNVKIDRLEDRPSAMEITHEEVFEDIQQSSSMQLRSGDAPYNAATDCVVCCCSHGGPLHLVTTYNAHDTLEQTAKTDYRLMTRLNKAFDSIAGDILYHRDCLRQLNRVLPAAPSTDGVDCVSHVHILDDIARELRSKIDRGCAVLLNECWLRYVHLCQNKGANIPLRLERRRSLFKDELLSRLSSVIEIISSSSAGDFVVIPCQLPLEEKARLVDGGPDEELTLPSYCEDEMLSMVHVALQLRRDLLKQPKNTKAKVNDDNCMQCVPESVYMFLTLLLGGQELLEGFDQEEPAAVTRKRNVLNIGQDLLYAVTMSKNIPPKQYSMGLTLHQATRDDILVKMFHSALQCMTYDEVLAADTAMAERNIAHIDPVTGAIVPKKFIPGRPVTQGVDNIDILKESTDANHPGFHGIQHVGYQLGPNHKDDGLDEQIFSKHTIEVPKVLGKVEEVSVPIVKDPPPSNVTLDTFDTTSTEHLEHVPRAKDMAFVLVRTQMTGNERIKNHNANWTTMNQYQSRQKLITKTEVGFMPLLHAPADDYSSLYTIFRRAIHVNDLLGNDYAMVIIDQALFCRAMELKWSVPEFRRIIFRLGGFHTDTTYQSTIGDHMEENGLKEMWMQAKVIGPIKADKVLRGKSYKTAMRLHKLTYQALWRLLVPQLLEFCREHNYDLHNDLVTLASNTSDDADLLPLINRCTTEEFRVMLIEFVEYRVGENTNFQHWWSYMEMVQILLLHTRAQREGDWDLKIHAFKCMLPHFHR